MFQVYQPSGKVAPQFVIWCVISLVLVAGFAFVYKLGLQWIPLIYVKVLMTVFMAGVVGKLSSIVVKRGKVRNVGIAALTAILLTFVGLAAKFAFQYYDAYQLVQAAGKEFLQTLKAEAGEEGGTPLEIADDVSFEYSFLDHIEHRTEEGWNVGRGANGLPISGLLVYGIWLIEAGIILYLAVPKAMQVAREPFSEPLDSWADESELVMTLPISDDEMVEKIKAATSVQELLDLPIPQTDQSERFAAYTVHSIPGEELQDAYLTVDLQKWGRNSEGEPELQITNLVSLAILTSAQRLQLKENAELMKEAIAEYRAAIEAERAEQEAAEFEDEEE